MEMKKLEQSFSVCQVEDYSLVNLDAEYCFIGKTDEETSLVCAAGDVPQNVIRRDDGMEGVPYVKTWKLVLTKRAIATVLYLIIALAAAGLVVLLGKL